MVTSKVSASFKQFKLPTKERLQKMKQTDFKKLLVKLNVANKATFKELEGLVEDKIIQIYKQAVMDSAMDFMNGKYEKITDVPMYKRGGVIQNIPKNLSNWCLFMGLFYKYEKVDLF